jgi:hypothetical protein
MALGSSWLAAGSLAMIRMHCAKFSNWWQPTHINRLAGDDFRPWEFCSLH